MSPNDITTESQYFFDSLGICDTPYMPSVQFITSVNGEVGMSVCMLGTLLLSGLTDIDAVFTILWEWAPIT